MSTTEVLSAGTASDSQEDSDHHNLKQTPRSVKHKGRSQQGLPLDILEDIEDLYENVPQIQEIFNVIDRIGSGTFSSVYLAKLKQHPNVTQQFALKHIIPTSHPSRIENELRCLQQIGGCDHVMGVKACIREKDHVVIVMPYFPHDRFQDYVQSISFTEVREYIKALLTALRRVHQVDIIHRDVKPSNFLYNRKTKEFSLVDFGLAMKAPLLLKTAVDDSETKNDDKEKNKEPRRTSPRKTRNQTDKVSPKKRKIDAVDTENMTEPTKKRQAGTENNHLTEVDMNVEQQESKDSKALTPITPGLTKPNYMRTVKSPRRTLLAKRALEMRHSAMFEKPGSSPKTLTQNSKGAKGNEKSRTVVIQKNAAGKSVYKSVAPSSCQCYGKPQICSMCIARMSQHAPRAGTQGFRSPEVLLKFADQSTAVDIWSAGVIFLSLLSGRYPFFKAQDDITALAQVVSIFGTTASKEGALAVGKNLICSPSMPGLNLRSMCQKLRGNKSHRRKNSQDPEASSGWLDVPDSAFDLLKKLLDLNPFTRITAEDALNHPFFQETL